MLVNTLTTLSLVSVAMAQLYSADDFISAVVSSTLAPETSSVSALPSVTNNSTSIATTQSAVTPNHTITTTNNTTNRTATVTLAHHTEIAPAQANGAAFVNAGAFLALPVFALLV